MMQSPNKASQFYTVAEVAEPTRVSRMTIYRMVHSGELPAVRLDSSYRVLKSAIDAPLGVQDEPTAHVAGE